MSLHNHHRSLRSSEALLGRRRLAKRAAVLVEALEQRRLLSGYTGYTFTLAAQPGTNQAAINLANGAYLQGLINGTTTITGDGQTNHMVTLGDTLILPAGFDYDMGNTILTLPNLGAAASVTWNSTSESVTALNLTFAPAGGYSAQPTVSIFGGGGSGATGTVTYNATNGTVTGITIGNHGSNYTSAPQVAIQGGAETLTIESSGFVAGDFGSTNTARFIPTTASVADLARISGNDVQGIVDNVLSDSYNHSGAPQNYSIDGIEICPDTDTYANDAALVHVGIDSTAQDYDQLVATNFSFNQDYIHGGTPGETNDDLTTAHLIALIQNGVTINGNYITVENSQISDIVSSQENGYETHALSTDNCLGNFMINNNYLEATGCNIITGGDPCYLPFPAMFNNVTITNNFFTKNPAWNPNLPQFAGVPMYVKNDLELKDGENVTISQNIFQNVWVGADQRGQAIALSNIDNGYIDPWYDDANITITDNVFRNVGEIFTMGTGAGSGGYNGGTDGDGGSTELANNITFENNLAYNVGGFPWGVNQPWGAITLSNGGDGPAQNITIENNTVIGADGYYLVAGSTTTAAAANWTVENNVFAESESGIFGGQGPDEKTLNGVLTSALTVTNPGSGYTYSTNGFAVTISGGGGSGATAMAYVWPATGADSQPLPLAGQIEYIEITNYGSGYTSNPTVTISGDGGTGATATAIAEGNGQIHGYNFTNNVIIGGAASNYANIGTNYFPTSQDATGFLDFAGDEDGLSPASPYYTDGTGGSTPGVNMATFAPGGSTPWNPSDVTNSLQDYYKFSEGTGTTSKDSGLGIGGATATATLSSSSLWSTSGITGGGIALTGSTSGSVSVANFTADASFTFAAWIKPTNFNATQYIASTKNSSSVSAFSLSINTSGQLVATGTAGTTTANTALTAGQWSLVAVTYSSNTLTLYVNGAIVPSTTTGTPSTTAGTTTLYIGGNEGSVSSFYGTIDEVRYYSSAVSGVSDVVGDSNLGFAGGSGYSSSTNGFAVTFTGGGGSGAAATAYADNSSGEITAIITTNSGSGYTSAPTMSFGTTTGSVALDTADMAPTAMSYLYTQYGPHFDINTYPTGENDNIKGKSTGLNTGALSPDETLPASAFVWTCVSYPAYLPPGDGPTFVGSTVTFYGAGSYLLQCTATNSFGQTASIDFPLTVVAVPTTVAGGTVSVSVSPSMITIATNGTTTSPFQVDVNGTDTSIANMAVVYDQFGNPMPSTGWTWGLSEPGDGAINPTTGSYTAPNKTEYLPGPVRLNYTAPDGTEYKINSAAVDIVSGSTPSAPATITVTPGTGNNIVITWAASAGGPTGYEVYLSTDDLYDGTLIDNDTGTSTLSFTDTSESAGFVGFYYVVAYNANGGGAPSPESGIVAGAPVAPTNLVATAGVNAVGLTWTNNAGTNAAGESIWRSIDDNDADAINVGSVANNVGGWTDNTSSDPGNYPLAGTTYYYYVAAYNSSGIASIPPYTIGEVPNNVSATPFSAPTGLTASAVASNQMSISWVDTSGGEASFYLQYQNANGGSWTTSSLIAAGTTNYLLTGLSADTQYNFEIEAYTSAGTSPWSAPSSGRTWISNSSLSAYEGFNYPVTGISLPLNGQSGGIGWSGAWTASNGYYITPGSLSGTNLNSIVNANLLMTGGALTAYKPDDTLATRSLNSSIGGTSGNVIWASALVEPTTNVSGYVQLGGTDGTTYLEFGFPQLGGGDFGVEYKDGAHWQDTSLTPVDGTIYFIVYELEYGAPATGDYTMNLWINPNPTLPSSSWGAPQVSGTSNVSLPAINSMNLLGAGTGGGISNWDELRIGTSSSAVTPLAVPNAPTGLSATDLSSTSIQLAWNAPSEPSGSSLVQGYDIWRSTTSATSGFALDTTVGSTTLNYTDTGLTSGTTYYYEVTAENTTGDSVNSSVSSATTSPAVPSTPTATPSASTISIALTWTDANSGSGTDYNIQRSTTGTGGWTTVATGVATTTWTDNATNDPSNTPAGNTTYYYQVQAYYTSNPSAPSAWSPTSSPGALTIPTIPTSLTATPGTNSVTLTWTSNPNESSYTIQRSTDDATWSSLVTGVSNTASSYTDTTPTSGKTYYYQIEAVNATGDSAFDTISGGLTGGVATVDAREEFNYPTSSTWNGGNTGVGFTGNWSITTSSNASIVSGLTYSSGTSALTTTGNALKFTNTDTGTQTLNQIVGSSGTTLWVGFEYNPSSSNGSSTLQIGSGTSNGFVQFSGAGNLKEVLTTNTDHVYNPGAAYPITAGTTYFIVGEIQYRSSSPIVTMWVNPSPNSTNGATPTSYLASVTTTAPSTGGILNSTTALSLSSSGQTATFDEIRLGSTYASVAPDPTVAGSNASGKKSSRGLSRATPSGHRHSPFLASALNNSSDVVTKIANAGAYNFYPNGGAWQFASGITDNVLLDSAPGGIKDSWLGVFN